MDDETKWLREVVRMTKDMQQIKFICDRAKSFYIEEKDIDEILEIVNKRLTLK